MERKRASTIILEFARNGKGVNVLISASAISYMEILQRNDPKLITLLNTRPKRNLRWKNTEKHDRKEKQQLVRNQN